MSVEVKLDAVVFPRDHRVFKFFPGRDYKFYEYMRESGFVFIDVRNLDQLGDDPRLWNSEDLLNHIAADRVEQAAEGGEDRPTRIVRSQGDKAAQTFLNGLLFGAQKGDMLLMPNKGYTTDVMIGQFSDAAGKFLKVSLQMGDRVASYFVRRVTWIRGIEKRRFIDPIVNLLHTRATFFDLGRSLYEDIYRLTFDDFVFNGQFFATFRTSKDVFTPKDNFLTSVWLELLEVLEEARKDDSALPQGSIFELVIQSDIKDGDRDDLSISVQSPGWFRIRSTTAAPLASLALFAMAAQGVSFEDAMAAEVSATIIRRDTDNCIGAVDASVRAYIATLGKVRWEQACALATRADSLVHLKAAARVMHRPPKKGGLTQ